MRNNQAQHSTVWVVIPTWNRKQDLLECIASVKESSYPKLKVVVVDNASTDGSPEAVRDHHPHVEIIEMEKNQGAAYASNKGFHYVLSQGADLILRLDSDTVLAHDYIEKLVATMKSNRNSGIVSGILFFYSQPETVWLTGSKLIQWNLGTKEIPLSSLNQVNVNDGFEVDFVPSTGMLIKRDVIEALQGFDQDYLVYFEDYDFCIKAKRSGYKIYVAPTAYLWHKVFSRKNTAWIAEQWNKSKMIYFRKNAFNAAHRLFLIGYAFIYAAYRSVFRKEDKGNRGPLLAAFKGLIEGLKFPLSHPGNTDSS